PGTAITVCAHAVGGALGANGGATVGIAGRRSRHPRVVLDRVPPLVGADRGAPLRAARCRIPSAGRVPALRASLRAQRILAVQPRAVSPLSHGWTVFVGLVRRSGSRAPRDRQAAG